MTFEEPQPPQPNRSNPRQFGNNPLGRILIVVFLVIILQFPIVLLQMQLSERLALRTEVAAEIGSKWGKEQVIIGPRLVIPYKVGSSNENQKDKASKNKPEKAEIRYATFLPNEMLIQGDLKNEKRYRGIFQIPVYQATLSFKGKFAPLNLQALAIEESTVLWNQAELSLQISDTRAIQKQVKLMWNDRTTTFVPGLGKFGGQGIGIHAPAPGLTKNMGSNFSIDLLVNGSETLAFAPFGETTKVTLTSNWQDPSFQGSWLPNTYTLTSQGFTANWEVIALGRNYPQEWNSIAPVLEETIQSSTFGVDFISPVDNYRIILRSLKYNILFIFLTFAALWLFETTARLRVHPIQYLMVGAAMCLFYLLQLALSEHINFQSAYFLSSSAVTALITFYSVAVLRARHRGGIMLAIEVGIFSYLYVVLANQNYSLLIGSLGLLGILAIAMYLTREVNWFEAIE